MLFIYSNAPNVKNNVSAKKMPYHSGLCPSYAKKIYKH